jgi:hypothetical protein
MPSASIKLAGTGCDLRCFPHSSFAFSADSVCASLFSKPLLHSICQNHPFFGRLSAALAASASDR